MPTVNVRAFSHKKSTVVENGGPKLPTAAQLELGEIAINFAKGYETLSIKNNNDEIVTFTNDNYWINKELAIAAALNDLNDRVSNKQDALEMDETPTEGSQNVVTSGGLYSYITEIEHVTAAALNDLNDRITSLALSDDYAAAAQGTPPLAGDTYETAISKLHKVIVDDELITSSALNDLNTRISDIVIPELILSEDYEPSSLSNEDLFLAPGDSYETAFAKLEKTINDNENITSAALTDLDSRLNLLHLPQSLDDIPDGSTRKLSDYATITSVNSSLATKQDTLVSGTNIKTINNESILGSGNITIQGGSGGDTNVIETVKVNGTALTPDANKAVNITSVPASIVTQDATHRFVSDTEKTTWNNKVSNVQSDWNATSGLAQILNKPTIPDDSNLVHKTGNETISGVKTFGEIRYGHNVDMLNAAWDWIKYVDMEGIWHTLQQALDERNNVQADWNQATTTADDYIKNKPSIPDDSNLVHKTGNETISGTKTFRNDIKIGHSIEKHVPELLSGNTLDFNWISIHADLTENDLTLQQALDERNNVQSDWNVSDSTSSAYIKNKPSIPNDSNLVHKTSNEDIAGIKYFGAESGDYRLGIGGSIPEINWTTASPVGVDGFSWIKMWAKGIGEKTLQQALDERNNVLADWNQTTTTAADYIKNKPHISSDGNWVSQIMFGPETTLSGNDSDGLTLYADDDIQLTTAGKAYYNNKEIAVKDDIKVTSVNGMTGAVTITHPVTSVNGMTGAVTLNIPDAQIQADWNQTTTTAKDYIKNKPTIPTAVTESTVSGWGFTKNTGTVTGVKMNGTTNNPTNGVVDLGTVLTSFTETDPTVPAWAKAVNKPTYTATEVGALPDTTVIPAAPGTLNTTATTAQSTSSSEALSGNITLHKIAKTGTYDDLIGKPTIPAAQVQSDWNATSGMGVILNKPTIPTVNNATLTIQKNGTTVNTFTANASSNVTANIQVNELPTVSASDNGKVLQVVNGAWALVNPTSIYSGTSEPDSNTGNNGDLYLQTS